MKLGSWLIERLRTIVNVSKIITKTSKHALSIAYYKNYAVRTVVAKQIYFTAWQILPLFLIASALLSYVLITIVVSATLNFGLSEFALELIIRLLVLEVIPLMAALFVATRSGAAINTEVALMKINNEFEGLEQSGIDPEMFEIVPRVVGGIISVTSITAMATCTALAIGFVSIYGLEPWALGSFGTILSNLLSGTNLILLWLKVLLFGIVVTAIPISSGLDTKPALYFVPIAVLRGMVRLFFAIIGIEVLSLAITYI